LAETFLISLAGLQAVLIHKHTFVLQGSLWPIRGRAVMLDLNRSEKQHLLKTYRGTFLASVLASHAVVLENKL
jgi:hypothetical protein